VAFYRAQGFSLVDVVRFAGRGYDSAILSKAAGSGSFGRMQPAHASVYACAHASGARR
jgi:hypothetical protein